MDCKDPLGVAGELQTNGKFARSLKPARNPSLKLNPGKQSMSTLARKRTISCVQEIALSKHQVQLVLEPGPQRQVAGVGTPGPLIALKNAN